MAGSASPGPRRRGRLAITVLLLCLLLPPGCSPYTLKIKFGVEPDANSNSPVAVSIVVIYKKELLDKLQALTAKQFFQKRDQILRDLGKDAEETMYEFIPGQQVQPVTRVVKYNVVQGLIFANYHPPGDFRYPFDPRGTTQITCGQKGLSVVSTSAAGTLSSLAQKASDLPTSAPGAPDAPSAPSAPDPGAFK